MSCDRCETHDVDHANDYEYDPCPCCMAVEIDELRKRIEALGGVTDAQRAMIHVYQEKLNTVVRRIEGLEEALMRHITNPNNWAKE